MTDSNANKELLDATHLIVGENDFEAQVLRSSLPVLVDFWAEWCGPCRMISPIVEALALQYAGKLRIAKINVDENPRLCREYEIRSIPTLLLFRNGQAAERIVGAVSRTTLIERLNAHLWPQPQ